jgi:hypothetical protein
MFHIFSIPTGKRYAPDAEVSHAPVEPAFHRVGGPYRGDRHRFCRRSTPHGGRLPREHRLRCGGDRTPVSAPGVADEATRDRQRAREDALRDLLLIGRDARCPLSRVGGVAV